MIVSRGVLSEEASGDVVFDTRAASFSILSWCFVLNMFILVSISPVFTKAIFSIVHTMFNYWVCSQPIIFYYSSSQLTSICS